MAPDLRLILKRGQNREKLRANANDTPQLQWKTASASSSSQRALRRSRLKFNAFKCLNLWNWKRKYTSRLSNPFTSLPTEALNLQDSPFLFIFKRVTWGHLQLLQFFGFSYPPFSQFRFRLQMSKLQNADAFLKENSNVRLQYSLLACFISMNDNSPLWPIVCWNRWSWNNICM